MAICNLIKSLGNIKNDPDEIIDFYSNMCSIEMNCMELSETFLFLSNKGKKVSDGKQILSISRTKRMNSLIQTCGFYDESGEFTFKVGLPCKRGIGGGIVAIRPNSDSISVWSPRLNEKGNSYRGMKFLEYFTTKTMSSIF